MIQSDERKDKVATFFDDFNNYLGGQSFGVRRKLVAEFLGPLHNCKILDVGCGDGTLSRSFADGTNDLTLVDLSSQMLGRALAAIDPDKRSRVRVIRKDLFEAEIEETGFNVILCIGVLAHVENVEAAIGRLSKLMVPGGVLLIQFSDQDRKSHIIDTLWAKFRARFRKKRGYEVTRTSMAQLQATAKEHDLSWESHRQYLTVPPIVRLWIRGPRADRYERLSLETPWLSTLGHQVFALLRKHK
jgi:2-polyprenyl-3-methyl-5-hydroxy-6-metoxy-1,4-benzoquinol methylase